MNHEKALRLFASILDDDLTVGSNHLIDDLPSVFTATDFLYFFALREHFWSEIKDEDERLMISVAMTESYLSSLLHVYSGEYHFDEVEHQLEHCILYGDLLSGAFAEKLILLDRVHLLKEWLELLQKINKQLLSFSLEKRNTREKKGYLVTCFVEFLAPNEDLSKHVEAAKQLLVENTMPAPEYSFFDSLMQDIGFAVGEQWSSAENLKALRE